jgi:hypothetical protein
VFSIKITSLMLIGMRAAAAGVAGDVGAIAAADLSSLLLVPFNLMKQLLSRERELKIKTLPFREFLKPRTAKRLF